MPITFLSPYPLKNVCNPTPIFLTTLPPKTFLSPTHPFICHIPSKLLSKYHHKKKLCHLTSNKFATPPLNFFLPHLQNFSYPTPNIFITPPENVSVTQHLKSLETPLPKNFVVPCFPQKFCKFLTLVWFFMDCNSSQDFCVSHRKVPKILSEKLYLN